MRAIVCAMPTDSPFVYGPPAPKVRGQTLVTVLLLVVPAVPVLLFALTLPPMNFAGLLDVGAYIMLLLAEIALLDSLMALRAHGRGRATRGTS